MRRGLIIILICAGALGCADRADEPDHQSEWRDILTRKKAAVARQASADARQVYADSVAAFVRRNPDHGRARDVYHRIQLEFADDLAAIGRHQDAVRFYQAVLAHAPDNDAARQKLASSLERLAVSREKLLLLDKGMTHREVSRILGKPVPGWTVRNDRRGTVLEAWYYRTTSGGLAGIYFREGRVFAAEENSHARIGL